MSATPHTEAAPSSSAGDRSRLPLLTLITLQSLDEDYQSAAVRRAAARADTRAGVAVPEATEHAEGTDEGARGWGGPRTAVVAVVAVFGLLATTAAVQNHRDAGLRTESRDSLITRIDAQKRQVATLQQRDATLVTRNAAGQRRLTRLATALSGVTASVTALRAQTGFGPVHGSGIQVTVTQQPNPDQDTTVQDSDLALLADGLWAAGADAVAVNGQRLTGVTAIRTSGAAIEVNGVGIAPPYTVEAIGDTDTLQARLLDSAAGSTFAGYAADGYFSYSVHNESDLSLPAAPLHLSQLQSASILPSPTGTAGPGAGTASGPTPSANPRSSTNPRGSESAP